MRFGRKKEFSVLRLSTPWTVCLLCSLLAYGVDSRSARADGSAAGFQLNRFEPLPAGESAFLIDRPWYSATRYLAGSMLLNYSFRPLIGYATAADGSQQNVDVVRHQVVAHLNLAASAFDRLLMSASIPVSAPELGGSTAGAPLGDLRLGVMVRLWGKAETSPISLHLGGMAWLPWRMLGVSTNALTSDDGPRVMPKLVAAGTWARAGSRWRLDWSATAAYLYRQSEDVQLRISDMMSLGVQLGSEVQLGGALYFAEQRKRTWGVGGEVLLAQVVTGSGPALERLSIEALLGAYYQPNRWLMLGGSVSSGFSTMPGMPNVRALFGATISLPARVRSAAVKLDRDHDGVPDDEDQCPDLAGLSGDAQPGATSRGCPVQFGPPAPEDRDHDGVEDALDQCPEQPWQPTQDPARPGCAAAPPQTADADTDQDGVPDTVDQCPRAPTKGNEDPSHPGCPQDSPDRDNDGIPDDEDKCPIAPEGLFPNPTLRGCPQRDIDQDLVPDDVALDHCPDSPGLPSRDPQENGCPDRRFPQVYFQGTRLHLPSRALQFSEQKDRLMVAPSSEPLMQRIAEALQTVPALRQLNIDVYVYSKKTSTGNSKTSFEQAAAILQWLVKHGIAAERLQSRGRGDQSVDASKPAADHIDVRIALPHLPE